VVQASILVLAPAFQIFRIISFHCYTVLSTVIATLLQTEAGKFVLAFFLFSKWFMGASDVVPLVFYWS